MLQFLMNLLSLILLGAIVGWIANGLADNQNRTGLTGNIILGVLGSMFGGWIMNYFGKSGVNGFNFYSIVVGVVGSIALLTVFRWFRGN